MTTLSNLEHLKKEIPALVLELASLMTLRSWRLSTAESCTGGLIAAACTDLAGSSAWFERGFVTYSNAAKTESLGVPAELVAEHGAVSEPVARTMAAGALAHSQAQLSVAVTGVAGPSGGSIDKPVGLVWFGFAMAAPWPGVGTVTVTSEAMRFAGDRAAVRTCTVHHALSRLIALLNQAPHASQPDHA